MAASFGQSNATVRKLKHGFNPKWIGAKSGPEDGWADELRASNRWHRLRRAKNKTLAKLEAQIKDAEHKITSRFISDCQRAKADTIVIGDLKGIRDRGQVF